VTKMGLSAVAVAMALAACGVPRTNAASPIPAISDATRGRAASQPPPKAPPGSPPPAVWAATTSTARWLTHASSCWTGRRSSLCVDMAPSPGPVLRAPEGGLVTFHFHQNPERVVLWPPNERRASLRAGRAIAWRAGPPGDYQISARYPRGDITYLFRLRPND
jgi:hypothetical protein